jgi:hypothetical protein
MSYILNASIAALVFCVLSLVFPPVGTGIAEPWEVVSADGASSNEPAVLSDKEDQILEVECLTPSAMV